MSVADDKFKDLDFEDLQAAVESSPKGRWFLEEYARRMRTQETGSILEAIAKLERVITANGPVPTPALPEAPLRQHQLKYFKQDEDLFVEAKPLPTVTVVESVSPPQTSSPASPSSATVEPKPESKPAQQSEPRGARLKIMRTNAAPVLESHGTYQSQPAQTPPAIPDLGMPEAVKPASASIAIEPPVLPSPPTPPAAPLFGERKQRIVITRKLVEQEPAIPLFDEPQQPGAD